MNKAMIIGNLVRDPELRSTQSGIQVCTFTVAVNRRKQNAEAGKPEADFFRVTTWRQLAENCNRYLAKGRKVAVVGGVSLNTYTTNDGQQRASLEVQADEVQFLSPREDTAPPTEAGGYVPVDDEELPF